MNEAIMLNITIYGPGCAKCHETERRVRHVVEQTGIEAEVRKATDFAEMAKAGVLMTPGVAVNGVVVSSGRIPDEDEIRAWLAG
ncbi:MAG: thioredoxin family protein [Terriglobales bacterium]